MTLMLLHRISALAIGASIIRHDRRTPTGVAIPSGTGQRSLRRTRLTVELPMNGEERSVELPMNGEERSCHDRQGG
jgi:hypothetical protein